MRKQLLVVAAALALAGAPAFAERVSWQEAGRPQTGSPHTGQQTAAQGIEASQTSTVIGCVTADADGRAYTLTNRSAPRKTLTLVADAGVDLSDHDGHTIEATGRLDERESDQPEGEREPGTETPAPSSDEHPKFHVSTVRTISLTCE